MKKLCIVVIALVLAVSLAVPMAVPALAWSPDTDPGLISMWHFNEGGGDIVQDSSEHNLDGTLQRVFGNALYFDGHDYVEMGSNTSIMPATLTVEAWIKPGSTGVRQSIVSKWDGVGDASYSLELTSTNQFLFYLHNGTTTESIVGTTVITVGNWYHVAGTYDGSKASLYVTGILEAGPTSMVAPMTTSTVPLRVGASAKQLPYPEYVPFTGTVDEVRISNVARTSFNLNLPPSLDGNTVGLWHFDEGSGQTTADSKGTSDGQLGSSSSEDDNDPTWVSHWDPAGPTWVPDKWGDNALSFDGKGYVVVSDSPTLEPDNITVEAWVKRSGSPGGAKYIVSKYLPNKYGSYSSYGLYTGSGGMRFYIGSSGSWIGSPQASAAAVWDGEWHHVAGTFDGTDVKLYLDQEQVDGAPSAVDDIYYDGIGDLYLGAYTNTSWLAFTGFIDEVRIWGSALGADQLDDMTPPVIDPNVVEYGVYPAGYMLDFGVDDSGTGVKDVVATLGGSPVDDGDLLTVGIYDLVITATDYALNTDMVIVKNIVVYDPSAGFVTGGGWIDSPEGAYAGDPDLTGKATFGFVSKYNKKGATAPDGQTEFQFKAGDLNFHSSSYQWLVVNQGGTNAQFKGEGTINGEGDYKFMIWAGDGEPDTFRIKIWEENGVEVVIYDNDSEQEIGGGSIVVHTKNK